MNDSSTGGYLQTTVTSPSYDAALELFFQAVVVGVTGMTPSLVRRRWQPVPPAQPEATVDWASIGITYIEALNPVVLHDGAANSGNGQSNMTTQECVNVLCTFYGPDAWGNAAALRDGLWIGQNREQLFLNGVALQDIGRIVKAAELVNEVWIPRSDIGIEFERQTGRTYSILNLLSAQGNIIRVTLPNGPEDIVTWDTTIIG